MPDDILEGVNPWSHIQYFFIKIKEKIIDFVYFSLKFIHS